MSAQLAQALRRIADWSECSPEYRRDLGSNGERDYYRKIARDALAAFEAAPQQEPFAWATHHEEPMLFPTHAEAAQYCEDDEEPVALYAAPQQEPVGYVAAIEEGRVLMLPRSSLDTEDLVPVYAAPQQAQAPGWRIARVSDGDIRVYGPDKETWLIRKDCGEGFYDFIYRYFEAAIGAAPQQGSKS